MGPFVSGFSERISKIRNLAASHDLDAIVIRRNPNLSWAIGSRVHVPTTLDLACFDLVVAADRVFIVTNKIEAPRLIKEELPDEIEVVAIDWWQNRDSFLPIGSKFGSDQIGQDRINLASEIESLRQSLVDEDIARLRKISIEAAISLGEALKDTESFDREIDVAARISSALWQRDLEIVFLGVAGAERAKLIRHPLPTQAKIGPRVVASICARRKGLIASVTRIVTFNETNTENYANILQVESALLNETKVGNAFSAPVNAAIAAYPKFGFASDEWQNHHQGGPTGYLPRDWIANKESSQLIKLNQPIAWNPTADGWKAEDTLITNAEGFEILTIDPNWPTIPISGRLRPDLLRR